MNAKMLTTRSLKRYLKLLILFLLFLKFHDIDSLAQSETLPHPEKNPESGLMLAGDWVPENTHEIDFFSLPVIPSEHTIVNDVRYAVGRKVNQHNYLVFYEGKFWAMWSDGPGEARTDDPVAHRDIMPGHDRFGQRISYSTSIDGTDWSEPRDLAGPPDDGFGWIARGFWVRDGQLLALVTRYNAPTFMGEGLQLHAWEMTPGEEREWKYKGLVFDNAMNNFPPKMLPDGNWLMTRRDKDRDVHMLVGGKESFNEWESYPVVGFEEEELKAAEPYWLMLPDENIVAFFRDQHRSGYLFRAFSLDYGRTWSRPVRTNFPDATSKFSGLRLSDGRYILVSNPNPKGRNPLTLAVSDDGMTFNRMGYLVGERHVDYPHVIEHEGYIYVAFASAKQSVEVLKIKMEDLDFSMEP